MHSTDRNINSIVERAAYLAVSIRDERLKILPSWDSILKVVRQNTDPTIVSGKLSQMDDDWLELSKPKTKSTVSPTAASIAPLPPQKIAVAPAPAPPPMREAPPSVLHTKDGVHYFMIRASPSQLEAYKSSGVWEAASELESVLNYSFLSSSHVVIVFVTPPGGPWPQALLGYGVMESIASPRATGLSAFVCKWIRSEVFVDLVEFVQLRSFGGKGLVSLRDGEEIPAPVGRVLCRFMDKIVFNRDPAIYSPESELLLNKRPKFGKRLQNPEETKLAICSFDEYTQIYDNSREMPI